MQNGPPRRAVRVLTAARVRRVRVTELLRDRARFLEEPGLRSVAQLAALGVLPAGVTFHATPVRRGPRRAEWAREMLAAMEGSYLVLLGPDNGLEGARLNHESAAVDELVAHRAGGRTRLLSHHQTRMKGGAPAEVASIRDRLRAAGFGRVDAIRLRPYSSRFYFLLDGSPEEVAALRRFAATWGGAQESFVDA